MNATMIQLTEGMPVHLLPQEMRYCGTCQRVAEYRLMMREEQAETQVQRWGMLTAYLGCKDCHGETYSPAEWMCLLETAEARLRWLDVPLGKVCTDVARLHCAWEEALEDVDRMGAPSECGALVMQHAERDERAVLAKYNLTPDMYRRILHARVDGRQAHWMQLEVRYA